MRHHRASLAALALLAGCGGGGGNALGDGDGDATPTPRAGSSSPQAEDVVRDWADAVRARDYDRAAELFALPVVIDNGQRARATRRAQVDDFNRTLPCGAVLRRATPTGGGRLLATFRLVRGPGGACSGVAQVRFRVVEGHITEWIRTSTGPPPGAQET